MSIINPRPALRAYLLADSEISEQVGAARVFPVLIPQDQAGDSIVYNRISSRGVRHMQGPSGLVQGRFQIDCWSQNADDAATLADMVKFRIEGFKGTIEFGEDSPSDELVVQGVFFEDERDLPFDDIKMMFGVSNDYYFWYEER